MCMDRCYNVMLRIKFSMDVVIDFCILHLKSFGISLIAKKVTDMFPEFII